jgi:acetyl esterase/lipase
MQPKQTGFRPSKFLLATFLGLALFSNASIQAQDAPKYTRTEDVIYGRKFGTALTLDVFEPPKKNGAAIFFIVSGGFFSEHKNINPPFYQPLLDHGYTVFAVVHGSQPRFIIPEIEEDIHRAIRFVRHNAARWGVDTNKFGVTGASAGGQLSLTIGTQGGPGKADAPDPVDRESSAVQAVACFCPPTDFLNWSKPDEDWMDFPATRQYAPAFGPRGATHESQQGLGKEISPIHFVTSNMPPTLVMHGDADAQVPFYQAQMFEKKCKEVGAPFKLIVKPGAGHGWPGMEKDMAVFADWFDEHLLGAKAKQ